MEKTPSGDIYLHHKAYSVFSLRVILENNRLDSPVAFMPEWTDRPPADFDWYFTALQFYTDETARQSDGDKS